MDIPGRVKIFEALDNLMEESSDKLFVLVQTTVFQQAAKGGPFTFQHDIRDNSGRISNSNQLFIYKLSRFDDAVLFLGKESFEEEVTRMKVGIEAWK